MRKKKYLLVIFCGIISLWLVFSHIAHFKFPDYFYDANPNIAFYAGNNIVSKWADFSYFTYQTIIMFGLWCVLLGLSEIFNFKKLNHFLRKDTIVCFIFCNYIITTILYTVFKLMSGNPTFGWYGNYALSWHSLSTNILAHYILFIFAYYIFRKIDVIETKNRKSHFIILGYLITYYIIVKITGEFAYQIRWFPYIIFDAKSFGLFFGVNNQILSIILLIICCCIILSIYYIIFTRLLKYKKQKHNNLPI